MTENDPGVNLLYNLTPGSNQHVVNLSQDTRLKHGSIIQKSHQVLYSYKIQTRTDCVVQFLQSWYGKEGLHADSVLQKKLDKIHSIVDQCIHHGLFQRTLLKKINKVSSSDTIHTNKHTGSPFGGFQSQPSELEYIKSISIFHCQHLTSNTSTQKHWCKVIVTCKLSWECLAHRVGIKLCSGTVQLTQNLQNS